MVKLLSVSNVALHFSRIRATVRHAFRVTFSTRLIAGYAANLGACFAWSWPGTSIYCLQPLLGLGLGTGEGLLLLGGGQGIVRKRLPWQFAAVCRPHLWPKPEPWAREGDSSSLLWAASPVLHNCFFAGPVVC